MKQCILSLSGGMDSTSLLLHLLANNCKVTAISFNYGQKHNHELQMAIKNIAYLKAHKFSIEHHIVDLSSIMSTFHSALTSSEIEVPEGHYAEENMKKTVVQNRNAIFMAIIYGKALSIADVTGQEILISLAVHSGDHAIYPDCSSEFRNAIMKAFEIGNYNSEAVIAYTPYMELNKTTILEDAQQACRRLELDFDTVMKNTNTCYHPDEQGRSCGKCGSCVERAEAFIAIKRDDPVQYTIGWEQVKNNVLNLITNKQ